MHVSAIEHNAQRGRPWSKAFLWVLPWFILTGTPAWSDKSPRDLTDLSLEDLLKVSVTSVSKKEEKLSDTPSAVSRSMVRIFSKKSLASLINDGPQPGTRVSGYSD